MPSAAFRYMQSLYDDLWTGQGAFTRQCCGVKVLHDSLARLTQTAVIIVWDEYLRVWDYLLSQDPASRGDYYSMVMTGTPGIGKSFFLYYALGAALKAHIPVVLYRTTRYIWVCDEDGFREVSLTRGGSIPVPDHALYLVDSNSDLVSPGKIFDGEGGVIVLASSPQTERWKKFAAETSAVFWLMPFLKPTEIIILQRVHEELKTPTAAKWLDPPCGTAVYTPSEVSQYLGPSARVCIHMSGTPKTDGGPPCDLLRGLEPDLVFPLVRNLSQLLDGRVSSDQQCDGFHGYFFVTAPPDLKYPENRLYTTLVVPTLFLRQALSTHLRSLSLHRQLELVTQVATFPNVRAALHEPIVLEILQQKQGQHTCHLVDGSSFTLGPALKVCHVTLDLDPAAPPIQLIDDCVYVTPAGYPSVDAVIVSRGLTRITLVQMTTAQKHDLNPTGVPPVIDAFERALALYGILEWTIEFIFLAPSERARNMAMSGANRRDLDTVDSNIKLGWLTLKSDIKTTTELLDAFEIHSFQDDAPNGGDSRAEHPEAGRRGSNSKTGGTVAGGVRALGNKGHKVGGKKQGSVSNKPKPVVEGRPGRPNTRSQTRTT